MKRRTEVVSFRADHETLRVLDAKRQSFGISRGDYVRGIVHAQLFGGASDADLSQLQTVAARQDEMAEGISKLNGSLPRVLFALLTQVGQLDAEAAKEIVRKVLP